MMSVDVTVKGFDKLERALGAQHVRSVLRREVGHQMRRSAEMLRREVHEYINSERHGVPNSPLTVLIKGSSRPLVDRGDLRQGIETDVSFRPNAIVGQVGVTRTAKNRDGKSLHNVAMMLHEGATIKVTPEVRAAVFAKLRERQGGGVRFNGGGGSRTWIIRGRPFIKEPFESQTPAIVASIREGVRRAMKRL